MSQEQEKIESLSHENVRLRDQLDKERSSNKRMTDAAKVASDCIVDRLEEIDELRIALNASKTREHCLLSEIADLRMERGASALERALVAVEVGAAQ